MHPALPKGIQAELDSAEIRTGLTPALLKAQWRIRALLVLSPEAFEQSVELFYKLT